MCSLQVNTKWLILTGLHGLSVFIALHHTLHGLWLLTTDFICANFQNIVQMVIVTLLNILESITCPTCCVQYAWNSTMSISQNALRCKWGGKGVHCKDALNLLNPIYIFLLEIFGIQCFYDKKSQKYCSWISSIALFTHQIRWIHQSNP